jgi:hypothetical protein
MLYGATTQADKRQTHCPDWKWFEAELDKLTGDYATKRTINYLKDYLKVAKRELREEQLNLKGQHEVIASDWSDWPEEERTAPPDDMDNRLTLLQLRRTLRRINVLKSFIDSADRRLGRTEREQQRTEEIEDPNSSVVRFDPNRPKRPEGLKDPTF